MLIEGQPRPPIGTNSVLVLNAGSSGLKFALFEQTGTSLPRELQCVLQGSYAHEGALHAQGSVGTPLDPSEFFQPPGQEQVGEALLAWLFKVLPDLRLTAVGHRVVHGGDRFSHAVRLNAATVNEIEALSPLAPLHQPHHVSAIRAVAGVCPELPQVACFDTAFHQTIPAVARRFALPRALEASGIRRYGFHGISYQSITQRLPQVLGARAQGRVLIAHLGNGASLCALREGKSIATTMGMTPTDGLMMGTRCGRLDPGVLLHLLRQGKTEAELARLLNHESGLLGVSGIASDLRTLLASESLAAREAIDLFILRLVEEMGAQVALLQGIDALIFTGGIGENASLVRLRLAAHFGWLGLEVDAAQNELACSSSGITRLSTATSAVAVWMIPTEEERLIAQQTFALL